MHASVSDKMSWLEFAIEMQDWGVESVCDDDGREIAIIAFKGPEFHFTSFGQHPFTRREIYEHVFNPLFAQYGYADTRTPKSDTRQQRFNERIGFKRMGEDASTIHYRIFSEVTSCQSQR